MSHQDQDIFGNFLVILGVLVAVAVAFFFIATELADHDSASGGGSESLEKLIADNIRPVGQVRIAGQEQADAVGESPAVPVAVTEAVPRSGQQVYNDTCAGCHGTGAAGAPKLGDSAAWKARVTAGIESLLQSAINGKNAMPPKGLCMSCSEDDLKAAIEYMVSTSQ